MFVCRRCGRVCILLLSTPSKHTFAYTNFNRHIFVIKWTNWNCCWCCCCCSYSLPERMRWFRWFLCVWVAAQLTTTETRIIRIVNLYTGANWHVLLIKQYGPAELIWKTTTEKFSTFICSGFMWDAKSKCTHTAHNIIIECRMCTKN